jgi:3-dehydroquinate synthase
VSSTPPVQSTDLVLDRTVAPGFTHRVRFTRGLLDPGNPALRDSLAEPGAGARRRAIAFVDRGVHEAHPGLIDALRAALATDARSMPELGSTVVIEGGEAAKQDLAVVDRVVELVERERIDRKSFVIAIGGGAVLDAVGFGASIAHRGVRLVRIPTTVLAQDDAAMGVKNGVNRFGKKNFVGAFSVPHAVLCDELLLESLPVAVFRAGFSEAVKIALLKDPALFASIEADAERIAARDLTAASPMIRRSAELHLRHIVEGGDPFETNEARPLDFGHWAAHRLESMSGYALSHGDAVAIGLLLDCRYSNLMGWLDDASYARIRRALGALGLPMRHALFARSSELLDGLEEFREHLGGRLTLTMLDGIGRGREIHEVDHARMGAAMAELA